MNVELMGNQNLTEIDTNPKKKKNKIIEKNFCEVGISYKVVKELVSREYSMQKRCHSDALRFCRCDILKSHF